MKASDWKPQQPVQLIKAVGNNSNHDRLKNAGYTTDRPPEKIDKLIKVEVKLDDGTLVLLPINVLQNIKYPTSDSSTPPTGKTSNRHHPDQIDL